MTEAKTKSLVVKNLGKSRYPIYSDTKENGLIWYEENSYKDCDKYLTECFSKASKEITNNTGVPDFTIRADEGDIIIIIECKKNVLKHQTVDNLDDYKNGLGSVDDIKNYAINGALHYATYTNTYNDVVAIGVSGTSKNNFKVTSFLLPKEGKLEDIKLLDDSNSILPYEDIKSAVDKKLGRNQADTDSVMKELRAYASACNNYLRANHISAKDRAGFISAIVLALTDEESTLYTLTQVSMPNKNDKKPFKDKINNRAITYLKEALQSIWENKDKLHSNKRKSLEEYYNKILTSSLLESPENKPKYFKYGDNILSSCIFSVYENIVLKMKNHTNIDIMGTFYTVFLKYAKGDTKDKGIVLTPKHITELFCDIAEHYLNKKLDKNTTVLDCCCGTGGFLIAALHRMDTNIENKSNSLKEIEKQKEYIRKHCLIGVEREEDMFALAYANMRFHGDGKSNLYKCSSLLKDNGIAEINENNEKIYLKDKLKGLKEDKNKKLKNIPKVGMINPPYSLLNTNNKKSENKTQSGQTELDFVYSMLEYLSENDGIGIAIVPMNCASSSNDKAMRQAILKNNTLLATMTMPSNLFKNNEVDAKTCIMVFRAGTPHAESDGIVFLSRWIDDGFSVVPHLGRFDKDGKWKSIKTEWMRQLKGMAKSNDSIFIRRKISDTDEWLAEAYLNTDYSKITEKDFESQLKKFALYKYMQESCNEV